MKTYDELMAIYERKAINAYKTKDMTIANWKAWKAVDKAVEAIEQWRIDNQCKVVTPSKA